MKLFEVIYENLVGLKRTGIITARSIGAIKQVFRSQDQIRLIAVVAI